MIPFYGATDPDLFAIERVEHGQGWQGPPVSPRNAAPRAASFSTSEQETGSPPRRSPLLLEPSWPWNRPPEWSGAERPLHWCRGQAQALPFADASFEGAYATWAYFFHGYHDISPGLSEIRRVTKAGGPIVIVDNAGDDEFTALGGEKSVSYIDAWINLGFEVAFT